MSRRKSAWWVMGRRRWRASLGLSLPLLLIASGTALRAEPVFSPAATDNCVREAYASSPGLSGHTVLDCVGRAAAACMMTVGGDTTEGMTDCLTDELRYWDDRLNAAYTERVTIAQTHDAEMRSLRPTAALIEDRLRTMQRAWIAFRNASCLYEQAQWMGGTGGRPATMACHMHETARQALKLDGWWAQ